MFRTLVMICCLVLSGMAYGSRQAGNVMITGTDQFCSSYTASTSGTTTTYNCVGGPPPPGAPTNCTATVNGVTLFNFPSSGGTSNLHVVCDQTTNITYNWSRNSVSGASSLANWSEVLPVNSGGSNVVTTYQVTPCIGANCVTVPSSPLQAVVAAAGGFTGSCPGFTNTYVVTMPWLNSTRVIQPMSSTDILLVKFTTGGTTTFTNLPKIGVVEYGSPPSSRYGTLSATPCDFSTQPAFAANVGPSNTMGVYFAIGNTEGVFQGYYPQLQTHKTYYFNIKNLPGQACSVQNFCQVSIDLLNGNLP